MSRNADKDLPPIEQLGSGHPDVYQEKVERQAVEALTEGGWGVHWRSFLGEGKIIDPEVPEGTTIAVVKLRSLVSHSFIATNYTHTTYEGYGLAYVANGEVPPFPPEAYILLENDHLGDDDITFYVATRDYEKPGHPVVWKRVHSELSQKPGKSSLTPLPRPRGRNLKAPKMSRKWPKKE